MKKSRLRKQQSDKCRHHNRQLEKQLADRALGTVGDIEDLVRTAILSSRSSGSGGAGNRSSSTAGAAGGEVGMLAHSSEACPYYSSRRAVASANVVCMPYSMLLSKDVRESLGISLKGEREARMCCAVWTLASYEQ